jgi:drug/metabolite transporter (DMT)-like permease
MRIVLKRLLDSLYAQPSLLLTLACVFWAGNVVAGRLAVGEIKPLSLVLLRWALVLVVLWPIYGSQVRAHWPAVRRRLASVVLMATLGFTGFNVLFYIAAHHTSAVNIGILQGSMPIFVLAGAFLAHGTRVSAMQIAGVLITAVGVTVVATRGAPLSVLDIDLNRGDLLMLAACVLYAFYTVALRDRPEMPGAAFFTLLALIAAATSLPLAAFEAFEDGLEMPTLTGVLVTVYVAIFPSCLSQLFLLRGVDLIGPGRAGVYINFVPVFAAILAVVLLGEPFALYHAVALTLVIGGILLAQRVPRALGSGQRGPGQPVSRG